MEILDTLLPEVKIVKPQVFGDNRGWFYESYSYEPKGSKEDFSYEQKTKQGNH